MQANPSNQIDVSFFLLENLKRHALHVHHHPGPPLLAQDMQDHPDRVKKKHKVSSSP